MGNENLSSLVPKQVIHHRHKSTGNLLNMPTNGSLRLAAKRTALADHSNINRMAPADSHPGKGLSKQKSTATFTIHKGKENNGTAPREATNNNKEQLVKPTHRLPHKYASSANLRQHERQSNATHRARASDVSHVVAKDFLPTALVEEKPEICNNVEVLPVDNVVVLSRPEAQVSEQDFRFFSSVAPAIQTQAVNHNSYAVEALSSTTHDTNLYLDDIIPEDEQAEALYVDAVEELPTVPAVEVDNSTEVRVHITTTIDHAITIDERPHAKFVDAEPYPILGKAEESPELSDYDDEAYGDDQGYMTAHSYRSHGDNTTTAFPVMFPQKLTRRGQAELDAAKQYVDAHRTKEEEDEECWDVSMVAEYGDDIFAYCRELEVCGLFLVTVCAHMLTARSSCKCCPMQTIWTHRPRSSGPCGLF